MKSAEMEIASKTTVECGLDPQSILSTSLKHFEAFTPVLGAVYLIPTGQMVMSALNRAYACPSVLFQSITSKWLQYRNHSNDFALWFHSVPFIVNYGKKFSTLSEVSLYTKQ